MIIGFKCLESGCLKNWRKLNESLQHFLLNV